MKEFTGIQPQVREYLDFLAGGIMTPVIRGKWYHVDPTSGGDTRDGSSFDNAFANIKAAYDVAVDGDGIKLYSYGATSAATTSYLTAPLAWSKNGITVLGVCAPVSLYQRARVANKAVTTGAISVLAFTRGADTVYDTISRTTGSFVTDGFVAGQYIRIVTTGTGANATGLIVRSVSALSMTLTTIGTLVTETAVAAGASTVSTYMPQIISLSGSNNRFFNTMFWNGGVDALEIGGIDVTGHRNYFGNCHIVGGAGAAAAATKYSLKLDAAQDCLIEGGTIGANTFDHGNNADVEIILNGTVARDEFRKVRIQSYVSAGTAHGAVKSVTTSGGRGAVFQECLFDALGSVTTPAAAFLSSGDVDYLAAPGSLLVNYAAWGAGVYVNGAASAASAGGGICTKS
jgi:hypothetical protein